MNSKQMSAPHSGKLGLHESGSYSIMASPQKKTQCVLWYAESKSVVTAQRNFRQVCREDAPTAKTIRTC